ncbi:unnamed protein product [Cuscuta europaea]|uniref:ARM repeat superfamily protein n=1 Tax=Cuscuta europaea TaxID=41803 RepID=A0A9P0YRT2_CUSEU|nr:unnamed protein product [Cuscuta europaea]
MSIPTESPTQENGEEQESLPSTHHPPAPSHELFDLSTTVDPAYVISLIRKLLPTEVKVGGASGEQKTEELTTTSASSFENGEGMQTNHENKSLDVVNDFNKAETVNGFDGVLCRESTKKGSTAGEDAWEEYGCILWDLAASKTHADFMAQNLILEVLFSTLVVSKSARVTEISLGIIGNLACHELSQKKITSTNGLIRAILEQLFLDDTPCLCEACRVVTLCLQGDESVLWAEALQSEHILCRILWIVENTLNPQLIDKSVSLLLAMLQNKQEAAGVFQPLLMKMGLPRILVDLLSFEMCKLREERLPERYFVLGLILQAIEALSVIDECSQEICASTRLFILLTDLIKLPEKVEVADCCITAAVLIANILTEAADLALEVSQDLLLLQGLFSLFPYASVDVEARSALWSIIARFLVQVQENDVSLLQLHQYVSVFTSEAEVIEEELLNDHSTEELLNDPSTEEPVSSGIISSFVTRNAALNGIVWVLNQWIGLEDRIKESLPKGTSQVNKEDAYKLLHCCGKYIKGC